jgi:hypothetical protein
VLYVSLLSHSSISFWLPPVVEATSQVNLLIPVIQRAASAYKQKLCVCVLGVVVLLLRFFGFRMG